MSIANDAHCHFFSDRFLEALASGRPDLRSADDPGARAAEVLGWDPPGSPDALADRWAVELDRHDVGRAALIASVPGDEESVTVAVKRHPDRLVGMCMIDPAQPDAEGRARRALGELGLRGVCLFPAMHHYALHDARVMKVFDAVSAHEGAIAFVHCGVLSVGARKKLGLPSRFDLRLGNPLDLHLVATTFPKLPILVPHFGAGLFREALMLADQCPSVHLDTSSSNSWTKYHPGLTLTDVFRQALAVVGRERLLFGTDSSFFPRGWQLSVWREQHAIVQSLDLDAVDFVFHRNFDRLFGPNASST